MRFPSGTGRRIGVAMVVLAVAFVVANRSSDFLQGSAWATTAQQASSGVVHRGVSWLRAVGTTMRNPRTLAEREAALAALRAERVAALHVDAELTALRTLLDTHAALRASGEPIPARVIAAEFSDRTQRLIVRAAPGTVIRSGVPVLLHGALLGTIVSTDRSRAIVETLSDAHTRIGVALASSAETIGMLEAYSGGGLAVTHIPSTVRIAVGDPIVTAPIDASIPAGIPIGYLVDIRTDADGLFRTAAVDPLATPERALFVTVLQGTEHVP